VASPQKFIRNRQRAHVCAKGESDVSIRTKKQKQADQNRYRFLLSGMDKEEIVELFVGVMDGVLSGASNEAIFVMNNLKIFA
jgi:hypothetical protein